MKRVTISLLGLLVLACAPRLGHGQAQAQQQASATSQATQSPTTPAPEGGQKAEVRAGTKISAVLVSRIDARTAKPGEKVVARVTKNVKQNGRTVIRKGDEIVGHVLAVLAGTYKTGSKVKVGFSQLVSGSTAAQLNTVLAQVVSLPGTRVRPDQNDLEGPLSPMGLPGRRTNIPSGLQDPEMPAPASGGGVSGSIGGSVGTLGQTVDASVRGPVGGAASTIGNINPDGNTPVSLSTPLEELHVSPDLPGENQTGASSVLSSRHGNLRLDAGTHVQFRVAAEARAQTASK